MKIQKEAQLTLEFSKTLLEKAMTLPKLTEHTSQIRNLITEIEVLVCAIK